MRLRNLLVLVLALALLAPAVAVFAAEGPDPGRGRGRSGEDASRDDGNATSSGPGRGGQLRNLSRDQQEERRTFEDDLRDRRDGCRAQDNTSRRACEEGLRGEHRAFQERQRAEYHAALRDLGRARPEDRLGGFALANGTFVGRFVSFGWDAATATLTDYAVGGCVAFDRLQLRGLDQGVELEVREHGRVVRFDGGDARLQVHDNPGGVLTARARGNASVAFVPDPALTATPNGTKLQLSGCGDWTATLRGQNLTWLAGVALADHGATFAAREPHPALPDAAKHRRAAVDAVLAEGALGGEVVVAGDQDEDVDEVELDQAITLDTERGPGGVRVIVNGTDAGPKTFVLSLAPGQLRGDRVVVRYFNESLGTFTEAPITRASSFEDVLDPTDDGGPEWWLEHDEANGTVVYVSIDRWSTHAFEVQGFLQEVPPSVALGLLGGAALVAVAGAGLLRRRQRRA